MDKHIRGTQSIINKALAASTTAFFMSGVSGLAQQPDAAVSKPNIVFILADDLGYGDVSCYGQTKFQTPNIDKLAANGLRFTQAYAGSPVCSPSRAVLHTGLHTGHNRIRGNWCLVGGIQQSGRGLRRVHLEPEDVTIGHVMQKAGYRTGLTGKWHLGGYHLDGAPWNQGYDEFYGWLMITRDMHDPLHFPPYFYENEKLIPVEGNQRAPRTTYIEDLTTDYALKFLEANKDKPFLLVVNSAAPHANPGVPHTRDFDHETSWTPGARVYAQKILNLDNTVGRIMAKLEELELTRNTLVIFSSDNGPRSDSRPALTRTAQFFNSNGALQGYKRDVYEGGVRVPTIAHWPGRVPAGKTSEAIWGFVDIMPTFAELGGAEVPERIDGISVVEALFNHETRYDDRMLYWEFYEKKGFTQAVRWGKWKAVRLAWEGPLQLFDLTQNVGEAPDIAKDHPDVVKKIEAFLKTARVEWPNWPDDRFKNKRAK